MIVPMGTSSLILVNGLMHLQNPMVTMQSLRNFGLQLTMPLSKIGVKTMYMLSLL
jgi:hypothetical protein